MRTIILTGLLGFVLINGVFAETNQKDKSEHKFKAPQPTIVTAPDFIPSGTAGGESDGKTIGIDCQPLADHKIYATDSYYFLEQVNLGIKKIIAPPELTQINEMIMVFTRNNKVKQDEDAKAYKTRWRQAPEQNKYYKLAKLIAVLKQAMFDYDAGEADINYKEQIRLSDRIDLNQAPKDDGMRTRLKMKSAIIRMYKARASIMKEYAKIYQTGKATMMAEMKAKSAARKFAVISSDKAEMFIFQSFERTPMLAGLAAADQGKILLEAKPIFLPAKGKVEILESKRVKSPSGKELEISRIRIKSSGMIQHDQKPLPETTLEGWTLSKNVSP
ncbi:MAG: hypothetical protein A2020_02600 [Lentisphaerae bacterium GWF2_45_14]|nr:MAG: hypothetical protein A2020_02600 [Lentisphaerae bacterium GWF2_45_14]